MDNDSIIVVIKDMPVGLHGLTVPNADGSYTVFINARDSANQQCRAFEHEISHIGKNDFKKENVQEIEYTSHRRRSYEKN